ncbi:hypothetical protein MNBD_GAMMA08-2543 [hydrothermal vent metagenome]|uniref:Outer membrane lipoprotein carrier protein LolA n=1 Tax=hydrothermal vent metagenome TaxID=652676 RepID=A0A3B0XAL9_9ZZZZ
MNSRVFLLLCLLSFSQFAYSEQPVPVNFNDKNSAFNSVINKLQNNRVIRSQFKQSRKLKILKKPLISTGKINFFSGTGIIWEINQPIRSKVIISENKITEITLLDDKETINTNPNTAGFYTVLESIFNGHIEQIKKHFSASFTGDIKNWVINLTPSTEPLNKIFTNIKLSGTRQINAITFNDYNQDTTIIELTASQKNPEPITKKEEAYFAL